MALEPKKSRTMLLLKKRKYPELIQNKRQHVLSAQRSTVVILINATTLMHKSTLSTNNFGNNHFGQKYKKENILRFFRRL